MADEPDAEFVVSHQLVVDDEAIADAGAQRDHRKAVEAAPGAEPVLVFGEGDEIVLDDGRQPGARFDHRAQ